MTDFTGGGIPNLDYDKDDVTIFNDTTEFTSDVFVYGKLYAEFGGDVQSFSTAGVERVRIDKEGQVTMSGDVLIKDNKKLDINNGALEFRGNNGGNGFITNTVGNLYIFTLDTGGDINNYAASNFRVFTNFSEERVRIDPTGQVILTSNGISGGGIYHHKRTISTSGSQFFKLENEHGATAATIYLTASVSGFSVSKVYQFAGQFNGSTLNLVADSGAYSSGKNIALTVSTTNAIHQFTCTATGENVEVFVTIVVGCANTNMVFTKQ